METTEQQQQQQQPQQERKGERTARWKSLSSFLTCLEGELVTVELKNDTQITGYLDSVDVKDMTVVLGKASQTWLEGPRRGQRGEALEIVMILGSRIRYVHLPDNLDADAEMRAWHARRTKAAFRRNYIVDRKKHHHDGKSGLAAQSSQSVHREALPSLGERD
ncbi:Small nuclear ribonucleoprotein Sm D1 [Hondaea fermentalgiana]|uniref:Small nuclear ribonucleoprotein Sm D1 n=1 Tax=Hondaea fermentalgiana TaxID=2315210 RepID=A0A2R5GVX2_9STRA|nr:Small nuclear ribonucleoprotein Sm D1 [Hondaea fermentalgiana]|eukprot:GBG32561.1 Small nuclear ribonucleoprotein Sm D1 [Hondaea fermentalgiana]